MTFRLPWENRRNYFVKVAASLRREWAERSGQPGIADRKEYKPAKEEADVDAALGLIKKSLSRAYIADLKLLLNDMDAKGFKKPVLVAPYRPDSKNMIARTFAAYLAEETGLQVDTNIIELASKAGSSQRKKTIWDRMVDGPEFAGKIAAGTPVIGIDDMVSSGGTLKDLQSYVDAQGGRYLFSCSLASTTGQNMQLNPLPAQIDRVYHALGQKLTKWVENNVGFEIPCLTSPEAGFLASRGGLEELGRRTRFSPV